MVPPDSQIAAFTYWIVPLEPPLSIVTFMFAVVATNLNQTLWLGLVFQQEAAFRSPVAPTVV